MTYAEQSDKLAGQIGLLKQYVFDNVHLTLGSHCSSGT